MGNNIIKLDGSTLCTVYRDKDGVHIGFRENTNAELKSGEYTKKSLADIPTKSDLRLDVSDKTFIAMCKCLLAFAERDELCQIINHPIDGSCWTISKRKMSKKSIV